MNRNVGTSNLLLLKELLIIYFKTSCRTINIKLETFSYRTFYTCMIQTLLISLLESFLIYENFQEKIAIIYNSDFISKDLVDVIVIIYSILFSPRQNNKFSPILNIIN